MQQRWIFGYGSLMWRPGFVYVERADALARELADVIKDFDDWSAKEMPDINSALSGKQLERINFPGR